MMLVVHLLKRECPFPDFNSWNSTDQVCDDLIARENRDRL